MYEDYDFNKDEKWNQYIQSADHSISKERLEYLKQIWYKENVNKKYQIDNTKISNVKEESKLPYYTYSTENIFKMSFMLLLFMQGVAQVFGYLFNFLALQRQIRNTQILQKKQYVKLMITNEFFHNLVFLFLFHFFERMHNILIYSPILMHSWVGISEFLFLHHKSIYERMQRYIDKTKQNKELIMIQKQKVEIMLFPILLFAKLFFDIGNWIIVILYLIFLKLKYHTNKRSKVAWIQIDYLIESNLPSFFVSAYKVIRQIAVHFFVD
ncbi:unnamed protein product [Paramecium pentaurelia]|uniref:Uncharacterized protein n=1 Tax=Paramecium pentaurelia TaxID=43138 RepID=A0A8S1TD94_9CILI|nr:unnamed protein product [Paramecium pentaurelia]